jgi:tight adherence protein B
MDGTLVYILIAAVTCLVGWGGYMLVQGLGEGERKKLSDRLGADRMDGDRLAAAAAGRHSIVLQQMANSGLPPRLAAMPFFQSLNRQLLQAFPDSSLARFLCLAIGLGTFLGLAVWAVTASPVFGLIGMAVGAYGPFFLVSSRRSKRQKLLANQIPDALDFLSRVLRAGHSLTTGLQMMGEELPKPIGDEFRTCYDQHSLGQPLEDCLKNMSTRIESTDFAFFITAVLIQRQSGGDLSEVLNNISGMIRQRIRLQQHVKAKTAEGRFTGYILVAFPAVMFMIAYVLNPGYAGILLHTNMGLTLLGVSFGLCVAGLLAIRKITTVKV